MTNKEYRAKLENMAVYNGFDYLNQREVKALREEVRNRGKYDGEIYLSGFRATIRKEPYGIVLRSYQTDVAVVGFDGKFRKIWDGYSTTTLKHVNMFREKFKFRKLHKREWVELPLG